MFKCQKNKFWLENISTLFCSYRLIPLDNMSMEEQMNSLSRLVIIIFVVLLLLNFKYGVLFLLLSLLIIIILYYIQRKNMNTFRKENYRPQNKEIRNNDLSKTHKLLHGKNFGANSNRFCKNYSLLDVPGGVTANTEVMSLNQKLSGNANPKTKIPPIIAPRSHDLNYWKATNLTTHSSTNNETHMDVYYSGMKESDCIPTNNVYNSDYYLEHNSSNNSVQYNKSPYMKKTLENFKYPQEKNMNEFPNNEGDINTSCGYYPSQLKDSGLPSNFSSGNCDRDNASIKKYNDKLYTQTIQPGIYTRSEIIEPINSNIGISFNQQFPPVTCKSNKQNESIHYTEHDPRMFNQAEHNKSLDSQLPSISESDVYDPRFSGYGTTYRAYEDEFIGQTRFYYDDINAIRMPNYITRSNIDNLPFSDKYGPIPEGHANGNNNTCNIRKLANDGFLNAALQHRTDISQKLMRKRNNELGQLRQAPIRTSNQRMLGGMASTNM